MWTRGNRKVKKQRATKQCRKEHGRKSASILDHRRSPEWSVKRHDYLIFNAVSNICIKRRQDFAIFFSFCSGITAFFHRSSLEVSFCAKPGGGDFVEWGYYNRKEDKKENCILEKRASRLDAISTLQTFHLCLFVVLAYLVGLFSTSCWLFLVHVTYNEV